MINININIKTNGTSAHKNKTTKQKQRNKTTKQKQTALVHTKKKANPPIQNE